MKIEDLLPRVECSRWGGATLTAPTSRTEEIEGRSLAFQWLGLFIEIGVGRVSRSAPHA